MAQAGTVWVDVRGDTAPLVRDIGDAARGAGRSLTGAFGAGARTVLGDVATGAGAAAIGVVGIGAAAVKASTEFNKSMSGVAAVAGATASELELLREAALQAGADTAFSASQAADAQGELVRAGVSVEDTLGGALTGALGLAAAGQLDLAKAAEISAQALNIFDLAGSETTRVADVLAAGANKSAADVAQLGDALRQGGLVAAQAGLSLEETTGVLALFADNALIGSDAGTSFKTFLQRLVPQSAPAADAMKELGLAFFDATGAFVGIEEVAGQLQEALGDLSDEQRQNALTTLFGSDAVRAASVLMDGGATAVREYTAAVDDQGAAARMAAEQLNNLAGDIEELSGSVETALIRIGDLFDGTNRAIAQGGTEIVNVFNDFATTPAFGAIQRNIERLSVIGGGRLQELAATISGALDSIDTADVDRLFARLEDGFGTVSDAAEGLEPVIAGVGLAFGSMALSAVPFVGALVPAIAPLSGLLGGLVLGSQDGRDALVELGRRAEEFATGAGADLLRSLGELAGELSDGLASALEDVGSAVFDAAESLGPVLGDALEELGPPLGDLLESLGELTVGVLPLVADLAGTVLPPAIDVLGGALQLAADATGFFADNLELLGPALGVLVAAKFSSQIGGVASAIRGAGEQAVFFRDSIGQIAATRGVGQLEALGGVARSTGSQVGGLASSLVAGLNPAVVGVTGAVVLGTVAYQRYAENKQRVADAADSLAEALRSEQTEFDRLNDEAVRQTLTGKDALDTFNALGGELVDLSEVTSQYGDDVRRLDELFKSQGDDIEDFRRVIASLPEPVRELADGIADLVESGDINQGQALRFFQALDELAQGTAGSIADAKEEFESLAREAAADGAITASQLTASLDAISSAETPEELNDAFALLQGFLGGTADEARRAANEILGLIDQVQALTGSTRDVDEAQRRLKDAIQGTNESFFSNGAGIDANTEAGRRNADAIQGMVEAGERLAEAQAQTDVTGESSRRTYEGLAAELLRLRDTNVITADEYQRLLDLYDLTPPDIDTRINADTAEATAKVNELRAQIEDLPGVSEPVRAELLAQLDQGNLDRVEATIAFLARQREAIIRLNPVLPDDSLLQNFPAFNPGGVRGARARGGPVGPGRWLVGEEGPEILDIPGSTYGNVIPNPATEQILGASIDGGPRPLTGPMADTKSGSGVEFAQAMATELQQMREGMANLASAIATARPINITEAASPRRTAEEVVVHESRLLRTAGI